MRRILTIVGGLVVLCIAVVGLIIGSAFFLTQDVAKAGDDFMLAIQGNRLEDAYAMLGDEALEDVDLELFSSTFADSELTSWSFSNRSVDNNRGELGGTAQFGETTYNVSLVLEKLDDRWLIIGYDLQPQPVADNEEGE
jgi:hypothetical protein